MTRPSTKARPRLGRSDVAALWNIEQKRRGDPPITPKTVTDRIYDSLPAPAGLPPRRYQHDPMPLPRYPRPDRPATGQRPFWEPEPGETLAGLKKRLRNWWARELRHPHIRRRIHVPVLRPCGCGSGVLVRPRGKCGECSLPLTCRERQFCQELLAGFTVEEIAVRCEAHPTTVRNLLARAFAKLEVRTRTEMVEALIHEPRRH